MKRILCVAAAVAAFVVAFTTDIHAQSQSSVGPDVGIWIANDVGVDIGFLGDFYVTPQVSVQPAVHYVFGGTNDQTVIIDGNGHYNFAIRGETFSPYVRGGLGVWIGPVRTRLHLNIGGGVTLQTRSNIQPFFGLSIMFIGGSDVKLHAGAKFALL